MCLTRVQVILKSYVLTEKQYDCNAINRIHAEQFHLFAFNVKLNLHSIMTSLEPFIVAHYSFVSSEIQFEILDRLIILLTTVLKVLWNPLGLGLFELCIVALFCIVFQYGASYIRYSIVDLKRLSILSQYWIWQIEFFENITVF